MNSTFFVDQETMEALISQGKTQLVGTQLTLPETGDAFQLTPAVKVLSCESNRNDPLKISDKYIPMSLLESAGVDIYLNSILLYNHSYHIDQGYICNRIDVNNHAG